MRILKSLTLFPWPSKIWAAILIGWGAIAQETRVQDSNSDAVTKHLIQQALKINKQEAACSASPTPSPTPPSQGTSAETLEYVCTSPAIDPKNPKAKPERFIIEVAHANDNHLLGLIKSGDDKGMTSGFDLKGTFKPKSDLEFTALLQSELYTKALGVDDYLQISIPGSTTLEKVFDPVSGRLISESLIENKPTVYQLSPDEGDGQPVRVIDVVRFLAQLKKGKDLYFLVDLGVEGRKRTPGLGAGIQDPWHKLIDANQYQYLSPEDGGGKIVENQQKWELSPGESLFYNDENFREITRTTYRWDGSYFRKESLSRPIAPWAGILGIGAGAEKTLLHAEGKCELVARGQTKVNLVLEGDGLGPNSRLENQVVLKMKVKRLSATGAFELDYFFVKDRTPAGSEQSPAGSEKTGRGASLELSLAPSAKTKGNVTITPFLKVGKKDGRLFFNEFNDPDSLMTFGFRLGFK